MNIENEKILLHLPRKIKSSNTTKEGLLGKWNDNGGCKIISMVNTMKLQCVVKPRARDQSTHQRTPLKGEGE